MLERILNVLLRRGLIAFVGINTAHVWYWPGSPPWLLLLAITGLICTIDLLYSAALRRIGPLRRHRARRRATRARARAAAPSRLPRRRPVLGRALAWSGSALQIATSLMWGAGSLGAIYSTWAVLFNKIDHRGRSLTLIGLGWLAVALPCFVIGRFAARRGRRHLAHVIHDPAEVKASPYVLYLRAFDDDESAHRMPFTAMRGFWNPLFGVASEGLLKPADRTMEEEITSLFSPLGRIVAVGIPGEALAFGGADRMYLPRDNWKPVVSKLIQDARLVILAAATTDGTLWELTETSRLLHHARLVVLLYGDEQRYHTFRNAVALLPDATNLPELPEPPPLATTDTTPSPLLWGAVHFPPDAPPRCLRFDPAAGVPHFAHASSRRDLYHHAVEDFVNRLDHDLRRLGKPESSR